MSIKQVWNRITLLVTGKTVWVDQLTGESEVHVEPWHLRWALVGPHSYQWWWVKRFGRLDCGCTRNPLTRRFILFSSDCPRTGIELW